MSMQKTLPSGVVVEDMARVITGALSGKTLRIPDDSFGYPVCMPHISGIDIADSDSEPSKSSEVAWSRSQAIAEIRAMLPTPGNAPSMVNHKLQLGLFIPSTNTSMETELWGILGRNAPLTDGIGIHTCNILTPKPKVGTANEVAAYRDQILSGMKDALATMKHVNAQYYIMGMSMEHIIPNLAEVRAPMDAFERELEGIGLATWHDAAKAALEKFRAKRISILSPFDASGQAYAVNVFTEMGFEVVRNFGFACATTLDIGHVPYDAKVKAIVDVLAGDDVDAVVQCGTNFSLVPVIEEVEDKIGKPVLGINQTLLWYALREAGFVDKLKGAGRLFQEH